MAGFGGADVFGGGGGEDGGGGSGAAVDGDSGGRGFGLGFLFGLGVVVFGALTGRFIREAVLGKG